MKIDGSLTSDLGLAGNHAAEQEAAGYDGLITAETSHDPFLPLLVAAQHTEKIELATGIAVAFARSPMTLAMTANDVQLASKGRFILGLGSQIKPHITRRFSMPWSHPAARMRELVLAMRAIWSCWHDGAKLDFEGDFYTHNLMTPFFNPGESEFGAPPVFLAAVGERMSEVAGEVCDGILVHGFTTERYLKEVTVPAVERGMKAADRSPGDVQFSIPAFIVLGDDDEEIATHAEGVKGQIAFYGSTPAYRGVLDLHGWGHLQDELKAMTKAGRWSEMGDLIDDEMLRTFAVIGSADEVVSQLRSRFGGIVDRMSFYAPYRVEPYRWAPVIDGLKAP